MKISYSLPDSRNSNILVNAEHKHKQTDRSLSINTRLYFHRRAYQLTIGNSQRFCGRYCVQFSFLLWNSSNYTCSVIVVMFFHLSKQVSSFSQYQDLDGAVQSLSSIVACRDHRLLDMKYIVYFVWNHIQMIKLWSQEFSLDHVQSTSWRY